MIDRKEMEQIAQLSKLALTDAEMASLSEEISRMLAFADQISSATEHFSAQASCLGIDSPPLTLGQLREDLSAPSLTVQQALQNVQGGESGLFVVGRKLF